MPDQRNLTINNNNNENQQLGVENEYNSTVTNNEQLIPLPQLVADERTIDTHGITDEQINTRMVYPHNYFPEIIIFNYCWMLIFFHSYINQFLHLLTFVRTYTITHPLGAYDRQYDTEINETQLVFSESTCLYDTLIDRDEEAEGLTAHPTDELVIFSATTMIVELTDARYINAYGDDIRVDDLPYILPVLNNENDNLIPPNTQNGPIDHDINNAYNVSEDAIDNLAWIMDPVRSVESQDNIPSSDTSADECTSSYESGFVGDDRVETSNDDLNTGADLLANEDVPTNVQDNSLSNGENLVHEQATTTETSSNEAREFRENVNAPIEGDADPDITSALHLPNIFVPKSSNDIPSGDESEEESVC
ncbi:unnamed protein product [Adineta steineri]|uniref:Uncharacterized protein n=1 Tax=Adineta steineri TaxID=433720 RepID=A0A814MSM0_9BILA|nr:unnamed protein product [Adineta steineri]CAF1426739.1 unnamed protein product [Adineta steineri]CAF1429494.1 unnamed protein product [Adineta steineri]